MIRPDTPTTKANPLSFVHIARDDRGEIVSGVYFSVADEPYLQGYLTGMKAARELVQWIKTSTDTSGFKRFVVCEVLDQVSAIRNHAGPAHGKPNKRGAAAALTSYAVELMLEGVRSFNVNDIDARIAQHERHASATANVTSAAINAGSAA